ncbi:MAG: M56 family metallopeptidase [Paludibacteraceae bacterium]
MNELLIYAIKVNVSLLLFYLFYILMYRRDTFLKIRRAYLLTTVLFSFLYPLLHFGEWFQQQQVIQKFASTIYLNEIVITPAQTTGGLSWVTNENIVLAIYILIVFVLIFKILFQVISIFVKKYNGAPIEINGIKVIQLNENITPFSFFNFIFINKNNHPETELPEILAHELLHASQRHSYDVIVSELLTVFCWFNPVAWLLKKEIKQNLEFLADNYVLNVGFEAKKYQYLLLNISCNYINNQVINQFNVSPLKKRITMMNKPKTSGKGLIKYTLIVPAVLTMLIISNAQNVMAELQNSTQKKSPIPQKKAISTKESKVDKSKAIIKFVAPIIAKDSVYHSVDQPPMFPGGDEALMRFLSSNIKYPVVAIESGTMGRVVVQYIINKQGYIEQAQISKTELQSNKTQITVTAYDKNDTKSVEDQNQINANKEKAKIALENEALRVINMMPRWIPGQNKSEKVNVIYYLPIQFKLQ